MGKYTIKLEEVVEGNSDPNLESWERDEESKYWIHRTMLFDDLYFNPNFKRNGCPLILTGEEVENYVKAGKEVVDCSSISLFYDDEEVRKGVLSKLAESDLSLEDFEERIIGKISPIFESFFEKGIYMPDVYGGELDRTANQLSPERMRKIIGMENFGFNGYRGNWNAAVILEIPLEEQDKILETLPEPIEYGTEYYGITEISKVVSPKYIKGMVVKFGQEVMFIRNEGFVKKNELSEEINEKSVSSEINIEEATTYLYNTEQLFAGALQEFSESTLSSKDKAVNYINRVKEIETKYRYYAVHTPGFVGTDRYKEVHEHLKTVPRFEHYQPDPTKGNGINMVLANRYYDDVANAINDHISESSKKNSETK